MVVILIILFLVPIIPVIGFDMLDWCYLYEISGRYFVLGAFAVTLGCLWFIRHWRWRYVFLGLWICLMCCKTDFFISNWIQGNNYVRGWLEKYPPGVECLENPPIMQFNAQLTSGRKKIHLHMREYYWMEIRDVE